MIDRPGVDSVLLRRSWNRSWSGLDAERPPVVFGQERVLGQEIFEALYERYTESSRKYHTLQHFGECLRYFEQVRDLAQYSAEIEIAPIEPDQCSLVDIDLSILGASETRFQEYERQIREEYSFVPETVFIQKRREILKSFLARPRIYGMSYFFDRSESLARRNLIQAVRA